ncbi:MAG: hypothetical protein V4510_02510 [bacterium]
MRPDAARHFHAQLRAALAAGAKLTAATLVKALRQAYRASTDPGRDPFGKALPDARALASIYAAWMETMDPDLYSQDTRILKHLGDAGWIEALMIVSAQPAGPGRAGFFQRGTMEATDFVIGDGTSVPQRNDLAWLGGFAAGLQGLSVGHGAPVAPVPPSSRRIR